jgi:hypothetical protein
MAMTLQGYEQQQGIGDRHAQERQLKGWAQFRCPNPSCACQEINVFVEESLESKPFQAPNICVRCRTVLIWEGWSHDRG